MNRSKSRQLIVTHGDLVAVHAPWAVALSTPSSSDRVYVSRIFLSYVNPRLATMFYSSGIFFNNRLAHRLKGLGSRLP